GSVVNTSSVAAWLADGAYAVSKLALNGITITLARELAPLGVRVNAVAPGPVLTDGTMQGREDAAAGLIAWGAKHLKPTRDFASPQDVAALGLYLLSAEAKHVN